ncbi:YkgJ family cysteine cluster protein [Magnetospirillum fulvum]|nr:YkgJ family cysteine cluster protein [Magnetospirillum fulvum]
MGPIDPERGWSHAALHAAHDIIAAALPLGADAVIAAVAACHRTAERVWAEARSADPASAADAACAPGCGWCCHQPVEASTIEVLAIAAWLRERPDAALLRSRLAAWSGGRICPFLVEGGCAIYSVRPLKCRGLYQPDTRWCMATFAKIDPPEGGPPIRHRALILPRHVFDAVGQGMTRPLYRAGLDCSALVFALALKAVLDRPEAAAAWVRGETPFPDLVRLHGWIEAAD